MMEALFKDYLKIIYYMEKENIQIKMDKVIMKNGDMEKKFDLKLIF
jgi:hypothetical protein